MLLAGRTFACAVMLAACSVHAFKLQPVGGAQAVAPQGSSDRQALGFMSLFGSDVHERITRQAYAKANVPLTDDVIAGVRWNDNPPPLRLGPLAGTCDTRCWTSMLRLDSVAAELLVKREQSIPALRSHFGDMQFLHAMAVHAGEAPTETREKAMRWLEFTYRVARGEIGPRVNVFEIRSAGTTMDDATRAWVSELFQSPSKQLWRVQDVFLPGSGDLRRVAFGSFLHLVQDSYSASHVSRDSKRLQPNGCPSYDGTDEIIAFHTYVGQDTEKHAICDDAPDWLDSPREGSPVDLLAELVRAYAEGRDWNFVKAILEEKAFRLAATAHPADIGRCFEMPAGDATSEGPHAPPKALESKCREPGR
jgi:hypothetical protein